MRDYEYLFIQVYICQVFVAAAEMWIRKGISANVALSMSDFVLHEGVSKLILLSK